MSFEHKQTWAVWERDESEPPDVISPKGVGWRMVSAVSPWRGYIVWVWERERRTEPREET